MRLFISINVPAELHDYCRQLQRHFPGVRKTEEYHLTLQFLGDNIGEIFVPRITEALRLVHFQPFEIQLGQPRRFPNEHRPNGVWIDCDGGDALKGLADQIRKAMTKIGFKPDMPFRAHITLGRYKKALPEPKPRGGSLFGRDRRDGQSQPTSKTEAKSFTVDRFFLMDSRLTPEGAEHKKIATFVSEK